MDMVYFPLGRCSYEESLKVLEADIQHANALAAAIPRAKDGARFQMKLVHNELAPLVMFLLQWIDSSCTCLLPRYLNLVHVLVYKVYTDGRPKISMHGRKATISNFYAVILPSLRRLHYDLVELNYPMICGSEGETSRIVAPDQNKPENEISFTNLDLEREDECGICLEPCTKVVLPNCCHEMCINCYRDWNTRSASCPFCRGNLKRVKSRDLWVLTGDNEVMDADLVADEDLVRFYLYLNNLPKDHPDALFFMYYEYLMFERFQADTRVYASRSSSKKLRKAKEAQKTVNPQLAEGLPDEPNGIEDKFAATDSNNNVESQASVAIASRSSVLQACTVTSGFIALAGVVIRQGSHFASSQGWPIADCSSEISFDLETWHLQLIAGLVILISSSRFLLLKTWSDFAESSEASNQQVLTSLEPLDYAFVAFVPGISEELLFRGALIPLFGANLISATAVAALFGILHLGSGRKFSFAIWATFVGLAYGYATILTSSLIVPMASHAINNLIGGVIWRVTHTNHQKSEV
ncbi:zinc finger, RING/FYVE/PHD-type [Artemisia annua]|uniref:Zinc finger, RING/FYVE/PHD-type n=1 Tax=Artemisia annua TaxID=35608 RepID=A0A2U1LLT5_ARTAN|nr:zinc finger, RING/FYVE/PHD-type [Artemisia annua]